MNLTQILITRNLDQKYYNYIYNYTNFKDTIPKQLNFELDPNMIKQERWIKNMKISFSITTLIL